jgi:hypothetical protein
MTWKSPDTCKPNRRVLIKYEAEFIGIMCRGDGNGCQTGKHTKTEIEIATKRLTDGLFTIQGFTSNGERQRVKAISWTELPE